MGKLARRESLLMQDTGGLRVGGYLDGALSAGSVHRYGMMPTMFGRKKEVDISGAAEKSLFLRRRRAEVKGLSLPLFGFAFARAFNDLASFTLADLTPGNVVFWQSVLSLTMVATFAIMLGLAKRVAPLCRHARYYPLVCAVMVSAAFALFAASALAGSAQGAMLAAAATLSGVGSALSVLAWAELQSCFSTLRIVIYVTGSFFLGTILSWSFAGMEAVKLLTVMVLLALASQGCLVLGLTGIPEEDRPRALWVRLRFPWKLVAVLGVYEFVLGVQEVFSVDLVSGWTSGMIVASLSLFVFAYFLSHRFDFMAIVRAPFAFVGCGVVVAFSTMLPEELSMTLLSIGYSLMFVILAVLFCDISHRFGVCAIALCSIKDIMEAFLVVGNYAGQAAYQVLTPEEWTTFMAVLGALVLGASLLLLSDGGNAEWGLSLFGLRKVALEDDPRAAFTLRCDEVAKTYRLSPRETEVLQLLALGREAPSIERDLCIAKGTLKSHIQRIYQKMDIHSRKELHAIVGDPPQN